MFDENGIKILQTLANQARLEILEYLDQKGHGTLTLIRRHLAKEESLGKLLSPSVVGFHLKALIDAGLIQRTEDSRVFAITEYGRTCLHTIKGLIGKRKVESSWGPSL